MLLALALALPAVDVYDDPDFDFSAQLSQNKSRSERRQQQATLDERVETSSHLMRMSLLCVFEGAVEASEHSKWVSSTRVV